MKKAKKSRRSKSKKVTRPQHTSSDDSMCSLSISSASNNSHSLHSDSDSKSSVSFSSSSSEGTYRSKKKVSRIRSNLKKSNRKKLRRRSSDSESSEDFSSRKKRKRSKKNADSKSRKKSRKYKPRRDVKSSSATSDSYGCPTCKEESGSFSEDRAVQKHRIKSRENNTQKEERLEERVETKKRIHRSPSYSSYSRSRDQSYSVSRGEETFIEGKSRRLRSVITFAEQAQDDGRKSEKDSLKEEIIYEHDDYPSPRSNDSSCRGSKKDLSSHSPVTSGNKRHKENVEREESSVSNLRVPEATVSRRNSDDQNDHDPFLSDCTTNKYEKESGAYGSLPGANLADDLEAVLRQKALENLRKFRGRGIQRNVKGTINQENKDDGVVNESSCSKAEIVHRPKQDRTNAIDHVQMMERSNRTTSVGEVSRPNKDIADVGLSGVKTGNAKQKAIHPPDRLEFSINSLKEDRTTKPNISESESRNSLIEEKAAGMNSFLNQATIFQASPGRKMTVNMENKRKIPPKTTDSIMPSTTNNSEAGVNHASISATAELTSTEQSTLRGQGSNEQQTEATTDGSQFEQKTMSVMRGGEMVQVGFLVCLHKPGKMIRKR